MINEFKCADEFQLTVWGRALLDEAADQRNQPRENVDDILRAGRNGLLVGGWSDKSGSDEPLGSNFSLT